MFRILCLILMITAKLSATCAKPTQSEDADKKNLIEPRLNDVNENDRHTRAIYAKTMLSYMNQSIDPCDDFYGYACGNWKNVIVERKTPMGRNIVFESYYKILENVGELLLQPSSSVNKDFEMIFNKTQQFYKSCLTADLKPLEKSQEYLDFLNSIGGFPAIDKNWKPDGFSWLNMSAHLSNYGVVNLVQEKLSMIYPFAPMFLSAKLGFGYSVNSDNTSKSLIYALNEERMRKYLTIYDVEESKISQVIGDVFKFWDAVLELQNKHVERPDSDEPSRCKILQENESDSINFFEWQNYIEIAWLGNDFKETTNGDCNNYFIELAKICTEHKYAVANYLSMKFLDKMDPNLDELNSQKVYCGSILQMATPFLIEQLYLEKHFTTAAHDGVSDIIDSMKEILVHILEKADLDESELDWALKAIRTIKNDIGNILDKKLKDQLIQEIDGLQFFEGNNARNTINLHKFKMYAKRYAANFPDMVNSKFFAFLIFTTMPNAYYNYNDNSIKVMAVMLNEPFFDKAWPNSVKYGALGSIIGHEITHAVDMVLSTESTDCVVQQYNDYLIPQINRTIDGKVTKGENIADIGGLRLAFKAYRQLNAKITDEVQLRKIEEMPGMDLAPDQLFYLAFTQLYCASYNEYNYWEELKHGHCLSKYRALGSIANDVDFAKAYACPTGSKMNPVNKCNVWYDLD